MIKPVRQALHATAAFVGLAGTFALPGTALAATPAHSAALQQATGAGALAGSPASAPAPVAEPHSFALPRSVPSDNSSDGKGTPTNPNLPSKKKSTNSDRYRDEADLDGHPGYTDSHRSTDKQRRAGDADHDSDARYPTCSQNSPDNYSTLGGYNGNKSNDRDFDSSDYRPECDGYHPAPGANRYDDDGYVGSQPGRRRDGDYAFGGLV
ncbi:MAG TPA: hypothetical protein VGM60_09840 [Pseudonocardia sp.]|uniref:hypothetical protein n=1 Tax=Pseudonocardia sp. TaxID=60912 RepID=UPI002F42EFE1